MCMLALFFIYSILMEKGEYYGNLTVMLVLGYVLTTLLMVRSIIFKHISNKVFYALWYSTIITWSVTSCYGLLSGNPIMVTTGDCFTILTCIYKCSNLPIFTSSRLFCQLHFIYWRDKLSVLFNWINMHNSWLFLLTSTGRACA